MAEATRGIDPDGQACDWYAAKWKSDSRGTQAQDRCLCRGRRREPATLLRMLSRNGGVMEQVLSTEPVDFKLAAFLGKVGQSPIGICG
jgi:hypothetical protein